MNFMPARQWFPSVINAEGKQLWYSQDRHPSERADAETDYIEEIERLKRLTA